MLLHLLGGAVGDQLVPYLRPKTTPQAPTRLVILQPPEPEETIEEPEPERVDPEGQLVELPEPKVSEEPEEAEYLAEHDVTVDKETRSEEFDVNPEVLAPTFSEEQKMEQEQAQDVNVDKPSTGAQVGQERFDPARDGALRNLPSPWQFTNRDGLQDPVPASHAATDIRGAPQNDLLDEEAGEAVALNAKEYLYAGYLNRIRRLVNFYWEQNLDNLPRGTPFAKTAYRTDVGVVLTSVGGLDRIEVTKDSGSDLMDQAVVRAFEMAGPFPNPPEGLIEKDGRVYLPAMSFTVRLGTARMNFNGVDPRAGVQFPGLMKSPR